MSKAREQGPLGGDPNESDPYENRNWPQPTWSHSSSQTGYQPAPIPGASAKSQLVAAMLACLFGGFGAHSFYLGHHIRGIAQLGLLILGGLTLIFLIGFLFWMVLGVWVIVEFILILDASPGYSRDSRGVPLN